MPITTRITDIGYGVRLVAADPYSGEPIDEVFRVSGAGGYVRRDSDGRQCCGTLFGHRGWALECRRDELLGYVRASWAEYRTRARRARAA